MSKLRILSGKEVIRILEQQRFIFIRQKGSHVVMQKKTETGTITVIVPNHSEIRIGTLLSIVRQSGLSRELFEA